MSTNKDLLKQAIAEARTVREAAIANAKEALEESLTPHLREMLAQKLQEMDEQELDEETINGAEAEGFSENPKRHGNVLREEEDEDEAPEEDEEEPTEEEGEEGEEEDLNIEDMSVEDLKDLIRDIVAQETGAEEEGLEDELPADDLGADDMTGAEEEEIDINELLAELEEGEMDEYVDEHPISTKKALGDEEELEEGLGGLDKPKEAPGKVNHAYHRKPGAKRDDSAGVKGDGYVKELEEALDTVAQLRTQLQEVNLLNAKLLYVNKVFKANNLTEGQKVNVVAAFDKAETVKEVKLVFETVSKSVTTRPATIVKEHKSFASKPAGSTRNQVINEVSEAVNRMQILAGIKPREY